MPGNELVQSVLRGLDIVETVAQSEGGLTLRQLAEGLELKSPTVHNLARTLLARGFLERTNGYPRYRLGPAVLRLADAYWDRWLVRRGSAVVRELFGALGNATVLLAEAVGGEVMTSLRMSPERPGVLERPRVRAMHPYATCCVLVFQAFWTEEERNAFRERHPFSLSGAHIWKSTKRLDDALVKVRHKGYADPGLVGTGGRAVAAPVFGPGRELVAALGASAPTERPAGRAWKKLVEKVGRAARSLSTGVIEPGDEGT